MAIRSKLLLTRFIWIGGVSFLLTSSFALQVGIVDDIVVSRSSSLKALIKPREAKLNACKKELEGLLAQFQRLKTEFDKNEMVMDTKTREQKRKVWYEVSKQAQAKMVALEEESNVIQNQTARYVQDACRKVAKQQKLDLIVSTKGVVYADAALDVTTQVVQALPNGTIDAVLDAKESLTPTE